MRKRVPALIGLFALCASLLMVGVGDFSSVQTVEAATGSIATPEVTTAVHHDVSPPLSDLKASAPVKPSTPRTVPLRPLPTHGGQGNGADRAAQAQAPTGPEVGTTPGLNFAGVGNGDYSFSPNAAPPDTNGAVGLTQYVQWVNESFAIFNKGTGTLIAGPTAGNTLWSGFGGGCETNNDGDPIVLYDKTANRWFFTQFSVSTTPYLECVAVSQTSDATGAYNRYSFSYGATEFPDYPKAGIWPDAYYITYNIFNLPNTFVGPKTCAFDRAAMIAGHAATQVCFQLGTTHGGLLPADMDGKTSPPSGAPNYQLELGADNASLNLFKFHVDFAAPGSSTLSSPVNIPVAAFAPACGGLVCIPQKGTAQQLDSLGDRLMYRLAYRNFGGHETLVANHSVTAGTTASGIRWYEIRNPGSTPSLYQGGTYGGDGTSRWMGSIAMDHWGDIAVGYSASSSTLFPSIAYTGRLATDPLNTLQAESLITAGGGSQSGSSLERWGDYSAMSVDPVDDCTFWYTQEYEKVTGAFNWSTRIASFKFPNCTLAPPVVENVHKAGATSAGVSFSWNPVAPSTYVAVSNGAAVTGVGFGATSYFSPTAAGAWTCLSALTADANGSSQWSAWACGYARPPAPVISFLSRTTSSVTFQWTALPPATAISISNGATVQNLYGVTTYTQNGLTAGQWVCVSGLAYNAQEYSVYSNSQVWTPWVCGQAG